MYAIIEDSGTQIKVSEGDVIHVDARELSPDAATLMFDKVLLVGYGDDAQTSGDRTAEGDAQSGGTPEPKIGQPFVEGATVTADILAEDRTDRVPVIKFKRRKGYKRNKSHRQQFLSVKITGIRA